MTSSNSASLTIVGWTAHPATANYTVYLHATAENFDRLVADAAEEVVDVTLHDAAFADDAAHTGYSGVVLETSDGVVYLASIVDPDHDAGLTSIELS